MKVCCIYDPAEYAGSAARESDGLYLCHYHVRAARGADGLRVFIRWMQGGGISGTDSYGGCCGDDRSGSDEGFSGGYVNEKEVLGVRVCEKIMSDIVKKTTL